MVDVGKYTAHGSYRMFSHRSMIRNPAAFQALFFSESKNRKFQEDSLVLGQGYEISTHFVQQRYGKFESKPLISNWVQTVVIGPKNWKLSIDLSLIC